MTTAIMTMIYATQLNLHRIQWRAFGSTDLWPNADDDDDGGALISTISLSLPVPVMWWPVHFSRISLCSLNCTLSSSFWCPRGLALDRAEVYKSVNLCVIRMSIDVQEAEGDH